MEWMWMALVGGVAWVLAILLAAIVNSTRAVVDLISSLGLALVFPIGPRAFLWGVSLAGLSVFGAYRHVAWLRWGGLGLAVWLILLGKPVVGALIRVRKK